MKTDSKKLNLGKETLKILSADELRDIVGGVDQTTMVTG